MSPISNSTDPITNFTILPNTFRFGADPQLTVITAYLTLTQELHDAVICRRTPLQSGEPVALIVAYDLEYTSLHLYCINCHDTQCQIKLRNSELTALHQAMEKAAKDLYDDSLENLLNKKREKIRLPKIQPKCKPFCSDPHSTIAT